MFKFVFILTRTRILALHKTSDLKNKNNAIKSTLKINYIFIVTRHFQFEMTIIQIDKS